MGAATVPGELDQEGGRMRPVPRRREGPATSSQGMEETAACTRTLPDESGER